MAKLQVIIAEKFLLALSERKELDDQQIDKIKQILISEKRPKADDRGGPRF